MTTSTPAAARPGLDPATTMSLLRLGVGALGWAAPGIAWRVFGMGAMPERGSAAVATRLFASRELALAAATLTTTGEARRSVLAAGVAVDSLDAVASVAGLRRGAPRTSLVGVAAGALLFVGLGVAGRASSSEGR